MSIPVPCFVQQCVYKLISFITSFQSWHRNELIGLLDDMGIDICKSWKSLSVEERQGAINAARIFNPKNRSFLVFLQASNLQMHHVYVLATFVRKCLSGDECIIEQDSGESRLAVAFKLNCSIFWQDWLNFSRRLIWRRYSFLGDDQDRKHSSQSFSILCINIE